MPKAARDNNEINEIKDKILRAALELILTDGFMHFSMRKLAALLGMTAANLYNYFTNKDELYLLIQTRGFEMLFETISAACESDCSPQERIEGMIRAYLAFGMENPEYYEIMFSRNTPKYVDYAGTGMEEIASREKQTALKSAEIAIRAIQEFFAVHGGSDPEDAHFFMLHIWSTLNGLVNLVNSRVLQEVNAHTQEVIDKTVRFLIRSLDAYAKECVQ